MLQHSRAPWTWDGKFPIQIWDAEGNLVCEGIYPSCEANARLIVAAPNLLDALQSITDHLERVGDTRPHKDGQYIEYARDAIAKAEGKSNAAT